MQIQEKTCKAPLCSKLKANPPCEHTRQEEEVASAVIRTFNLLDGLLTTVGQDEHSYCHANEAMKSEIPDTLNFFLNNELPNLPLKTDLQKIGGEECRLASQIIEHLMTDSFSQEKRLEILHTIVKILEETNIVGRIRGTLCKSPIFSSHKTRF